MQSHRKKLLIWFTTFVLIMACVPAVATPVPTLDPNAINTFIAQTADGASTQTAAAVPLFTATAPIRAVLRDTFTPEPTFTAVAPIIFPSPVITAKIQYFRVKHDSQLAIHNYRSRTGDSGWTGGSQTPETVRMLILPKLTSETHRTKLDNSWEAYINDLNDRDKQKLRYLKASNTALFNKSGFPLLESLTMGGNVIVLDQIQGNWGRVHTLDLASPGSLKDVNYVTRPDLVHKFVVVVWDQPSKSTYWVNPPPGTIYWPLVSDRAIWIPMEYVEPFPILPMDVTINRTQAIRREPSKDSPLTGVEVLEGESATVVDYHPSGSEVWGRLSSGGWIGLLMREKGALHYLTSWSMATVPPP